MYVCMFLNSSDTTGQIWLIFFCLFEGSVKYKPWGWPALYFMTIATKLFELEKKINATGCSELKGLVLPDTGARYRGASEMLWWPIHDIWQHNFVHAYFTIRCTTNQLTMLRLNELWKKRINDNLIICRYWVALRSCCDWKNYLDRLIISKVIEVFVIKIIGI